MRYNKEPRVVVTIHLPVSLVERINDIVPKWAIDNKLNPAKSKTRWYMDTLSKALDEYQNKNKNACKTSCGFVGVEKRKAPWPDWKGNHIFEGDTIVHPTGEKGIVCFCSVSPFDSREVLTTPEDQWRVQYEGENQPTSRLNLQIGNKGMAVVEKGYPPPGVIVHEYLYAISRSGIEGFISGPFETLEGAKQDIVLVDDGDVLFELYGDGNMKPLYVSKNGEWTDDF